MDNSYDCKKRCATYEIGNGSSVRESDAELIDATKRGEGRAFEILVKRHQKRVFSVAFGISRNHEDAEDISQQCFMKAFVHLGTFSGQSTFSTWLTRIAINEALMSLRRARSQKAVSIHEVLNDDGTSAPFEIPDASEGVEERYAQIEKARLISAATDKLTPDIRRTLQLTLEDRTVTESAKILRVSVSTVKARLFRARRKLRPTLTRLLKPDYRKTERSARAAWTFRQRANIIATLPTGISSDERA